MKNTYVNLISMFDLSHINRIQQAHWYCRWIHSVIDECGCIDKGSEDELEMVDKNIAVMNRRSKRFAEDFTNELRLQNRTDMAVVYHDFAEGIGPQLDIDFLSKLDCFHPSASAQQDLAIALWNSMLCTDDRAGHCGQAFQQGMKPVCATETSFLLTGGLSSDRIMI